MLTFVVENLAPSELKKLRNKQRKAKRKAEQESAQAAQAQVKRDQHHKSKQQGDVEADAPQLDELVPEKLAKVGVRPETARGILCDEIYNCRSTSLWNKLSSSYSLCRRWQRTESKLISWPSRSTTGKVSFIVFRIDFRPFYLQVECFKRFLRCCAFLYVFWKCRNVSFDFDLFDFFVSPSSFVPFQKRTS